MSDSHHDVEATVKTYKKVGLALIVLTFVTVGASYIDIGFGLGVGLALLIATFKGSLVAGYFMHLVHEKKPIYWIMILSILFFLVLLLIPTFWHLDVITQ